MPIRRSIPAMMLLAAMLAPSALLAAEPPVSFTREIVPILRAECNGCHKPGKTKGGLDTTSYAALLKGGKDHGAAILPGNPSKSPLVSQISGPEPEMPEDKDPLKAEQVALIARWVQQGARDDSPAVVEIPADPPVYHAPPVITSLAYSPNGALLAVNGYHEVLLHSADGSQIVGRLIGAASRIESVVFSPDGSRLGVAGGSPGEFGHVQVWDPVERRLVHAYKISNDSLYGLSFSPDGKQVAVGGADKSAYRVNVADGAILTELKAHADWVLGTTFTADGKQMVTGGRDKALKLIDIETGRFIDDINNPLEVIVGFARHPKEMQVAYGGQLGTPYLYKISDNQGRTVARKDANLVRKFDRQKGPAYCVAFSPDGAMLAAGSVDEVRLYKTADGSLAQTLAGHRGPVYAIAFSPDGKTVATGGFDGKVRLFDPATGALAKEFSPVPLQKVAAESKNAAAKPVAGK